MESNELKPQNPFLFLLLKAMFKWEVKWFYNDLSKVSLSKHILFDKPLKLHEKPPKDFGLSDDEIVEKASYIRTYLIEKVGDLMFSEDKLNELVRCVKTLNNCDTWKKFSYQRHLVEYATWARNLMNGDRLYSKLSILEKNAINSRVNVAIENELSLARMTGKFLNKTHWNSGIFIPPNRYLRPAFDEDHEAIDVSFRTSEQFKFDDIEVWIKKGLFWVLVDDVYQVKGWVLASYEKRTISEKRFKEARDRDNMHDIAMSLPNLEKHLPNEKLFIQTFDHDDNKIKFVFFAINPQDIYTIFYKLLDLYTNLDEKYKLL